MSYGLPYMGSKRRIAEWILGYLPPATHFYDLFAGGCSISHVALLSGKYRYIHINDIQPTMPMTFKDAILGKFADEKRWISHDEFFEKRCKGDMYIDLCFSFGNNADGSYAFSKELEPYKKAAHYAILMGDYSSTKELFGVDVSHIGMIEDVSERYSAYKRIIKEKTSYGDGFSRLQSLERLLRIDGLKSLNHPHINEIMTVTSKSYDEVCVEANSVIYCDIPYKNTALYNKRTFDYSVFYDWACSQDSLVYISEYDMPSDRFTCIAEKQKYAYMGATTKSDERIERLFVPNKQVDKIYKTTLF